MTYSTVTQKVGAYLRLMRFDRPIGTLLLLWPTLWALWIAGGGVPPLEILVVFIAGVVLMRAAGCVINDYADRHIDGHVQRTRARPLVTNMISTKGALILFVSLCLAAFVLVLFLNRETLLLALPALGLAAFYPFAKRFFPVPQIFLGLAFSWSIPMAFAAVLGYVPGVAWILFLANVSWTVAYDTQYAMADRKDDLKLGVKSSAIFFGQYDRFWIVVLQLVMLLSLILIGQILRLGSFYYLSLALAGAFMGYQFYFTYGQKPASCFRAFLNNNWVGALVFLGVVLGCASVFG